MEPEWREDAKAIEAIDDLLMKLEPEIDEVLKRLFPYVSLPSGDAEMMLFCVLGNFITGYHFSRSEGESPPEAYHRGLSAVLSNEAVAQFLQRIGAIGAQAVVGGFHE